MQDDSQIDLPGDEPVDPSLVDEEVTDDWDEETVDSPTATQSLRYHGVDFDVNGLVRRLHAEELIVPSFDPDGATETGYEAFQRGFVWPRRQMDRFIDSLLLGYPVPGLFLVELENRKYMVMDGQQRIRTLGSFYRGSYRGSDGKKKAYALRYAGASFNGLGYDDLSPADKRLLDNTFISATIVTPRGPLGKQAVYTLFERINSSGMKLQPQEIRVALFAGPLMHLLRHLNDSEGWRRIFGDKHSRLRDQELILRFLALAEFAVVAEPFDWDIEAAREKLDGDTRKNSLYKPAMSRFLNSFLERHEGLHDFDSEAWSKVFETTCALLADAEGRAALRPFGRTQVNSAHCDAVLVGLGMAIRQGREFTGVQVSQALGRLAEDQAYVRSISGSTSHSDSVITRLRISSSVFGEASSS